MDSKHLDVNCRECRSPAKYNGTDLSA
jgi:hypothetical protein